MPGGRHEHGVGDAIVEWDGVAPSVESGRLGAAFGEDRSHACIRLDADHPLHPLDEQPSKGASAGSEIDDNARADRQQPVDHFRCRTRPVAVVV